MEQAATTHGASGTQDGAVVIQLTINHPREKLLELMREYSEDQRCAGWYVMLSEFIDSKLRGPLAVPSNERSHDLQMIAQLHEACGGWWEYDLADDDELRFFPMAEWESTFADEIASSWAHQRKCIAEGITTEAEGLRRGVEEFIHRHHHNLYNTSPGGI